MHASKCILLLVSTWSYGHQTLLHQRIFVLRNTRAKKKLQHLREGVRELGNLSILINIDTSTELNKIQHWESIYQNVGTLLGVVVVDGSTAIWSSQHHQPVVYPFPIMCCNSSKSDHYGPMEPTYDVSTGQHRISGT